MRSFSTSSGVSTSPSGRDLPSLSSWSTTAGLGISFLSFSSISDDLDFDLDALTKNATTCQVETIKTKTQEKQNA